MFEILNLVNLCDQWKTKAKDLSCSSEEMHPHHSHVFDKIYLEATKYLVQDVATSVEA